MTNRMQQRRGTAALWTSRNPVLAAGEIGYETDTGRQKIGDGTTAWTALPYRIDDPDSDYTVTGEWTFDPPLLGTLDETYASDQIETTAITVKAKGLGTAALNVVKYDDAPLDGSGYGVAHIDNDGGAGFAGGRVNISEQGHVAVDAETGNDALTVKTGGWPAFVVAPGYATVAVASQLPADVGIFVGQATGQTADSVQVFNGDPFERVFAVTASGAVIVEPSDLAKAPLTVSAGTAPANADLANGQLAMWYDSAGGNPKVRFKGKDSAGAVFTFTLSHD